MRLPLRTFNAQSRHNLTEVGGDNKFTFNYISSASSERRSGVYKLIKFFFKKGISEIETAYEQGLFAHV